MVNNNIDFINMFEKKLSNYTGFKYSICTDCCTNAILLSIEMLNRLNKINKQQEILHISEYTYMSIPMTLKNHGWNIKLVNDKWFGKYEIGNFNVYDAATDFHENMRSDNEYNENSLVCVSFQQKKRLSLGRGGAILTDNIQYYKLLKRLCYDGRNPYISDKHEIINNANDIICGYHCYMEPDKAVKGILMLNQKQLLPIYKTHSWNEYTSLKLIGNLFK